MDALIEPNTTSPQQAFKHQNSFLLVQYLQMNQLK